MISWYAMWMKFTVLTDLNMGRCVGRAADSPSCC